MYKRGNNKDIFSCYKIKTHFANDYSASKGPVILSAQTGKKTLSYAILFILAPPPSLVFAFSAGSLPKEVWWSASANHGAGHFYSGTINSYIMLLPRNCFLFTWMCFSRVQVDRWSSGQNVGSLGHSAVTEEPRW